MEDSTQSPKSYYQFLILLGNKKKISKLIIIKKYFNINTHFFS